MYVIPQFLVKTNTHTDSKMPVKTSKFFFLKICKCTFIPLFFFQISIIMDLNQVKLLAQDFYVPYVFVHSEANLSWFHMNEASTKNETVIISTDMQIKFGFTI